MKSPKIHSFLALHLENMMTAESAAATATSDQAELHSLQRRGVMLLSALVWYFRNAMESKHAAAAETNGPIALIQLSPQINSSVRHNFDGFRSTHHDQRLFLSRCDAVVLLATVPMIKDITVLRRLFRPVISLDFVQSFSSFPICDDDLFYVRRSPICSE
ncbi:MAG: hypothetical protein ACREBR_00250 [bacterium]